MVIEFKNIIFSNILSFGSKETTFNFENGFNLISGINGSGKSSLLDSLSFCLFGVPYRKINIEELINRKNKKNLKVTCNFKINDKDEYQITRGLKPNILKIYKNDQQIELLSSKKLNQEEIDKILGINHQLFKQIISLAVNYNKPFLSLSSAEKRDIIEQIFNIKIFGKMLKAHKIINSEIKVKYKTQNSNLGILKENLKSLRNRVLQLQQAKDNFEENKNNDLKIIQNRIDKEKEKEKLLTNKHNNLKSQLENIKKPIELNNLKTLRDNNNKEITEKEYQNTQCLKNINIINTNSKCPLCNHNITLEHKKEELERINKIINDNNKSLKEIKKIKEKIEKNINKINETNKQIDQLNSEIKNIKNQIDMINNNLENLKKDKINIQKRKIDFNLENITKEFEEKILEYKKAFKETESLKNRLNNNKTVTSILSETGIKSFIFKKLTPILNSKVNRYITTFRLPIEINFNEFMEETIRNIDSLQKNISYYSYSEGEKKRIDIAIWLSFIDITKLICNWKSNLLIFDELLDGQVDDNGLEKIINCLKHIIQLENMCSYVISHRLNESTGFDNKFEIKKNGYGFSSIQTIVNN